MNATAVGPDMKAAAHEDRADLAGPLRRHVPRPRRRQLFRHDQPGAGQAPIRAGVTVPYSDEFRDRGCQRCPAGAACRGQAEGRPARQTHQKPAEPRRGRDQAAGAAKTFRHDLPKATSSQDAWHYFLLACCVLFCDVFCRRVHVNFGWVPPLAGRARDWVLRRQPVPAHRVYAAFAEPQGGSLRPVGSTPAATRFEPTAQLPADVKPLEELAPPLPVEPRAPSLAPEKKEEESNGAIVEGEEEGLGGTGVCGKSSISGQGQGAKGRCREKRKSEAYDHCAIAPFRENSFFQTVLGDIDVPANHVRIVWPLPFETYQARAGLLDSVYEAVKHLNFASTVCIVEMNWQFLKEWGRRRCCRAIACGCWMGTIWPAPTIAFSSCVVCAAVLPGQALVFYDPRFDLPVIPCGRPIRDAD